MLPPSPGRDAGASEAGTSDAGAPGRDDAAPPDAEGQGGGTAMSKTITILSARVSGTGRHQDFPVFVSLVDPDLRKSSRADGCDIAFYQGSSRLDFEIEDFDLNYTASEARLVAWVRIPSLGTSSDTTLKLYYGLPCSAYQNPRGVWESNYRLVWHMPGDAGSRVLDSTGNGFHGTLHGSPGFGPGQLGNSLLLDGVDDRVEGPLASELMVLGSAPKTFSIWANIQNHQSTPYGDIFGIGAIGGGCCTYRGFGINRSGDRTSFSVGGEWIQNANWNIFEDGSGIANWMHYAATYDGNTGLKIYLNGQLVQEAVLDSPLKTSDENPLRLRYSNYIIGGPRDEMRVSTRVIGADWIQTEYANQSDPSGFYAVGPETVGPVP